MSRGRWQPPPGAGHGNQRIHNVIFERWLRSNTSGLSGVVPERPGKHQPRPRDLTQRGGAKAPARPRNAQRTRKLANQTLLRKPDGSPGAEPSQEATDG